MNTPHWDRFSRIASATRRVLEVAEEAIRFNHLYALAQATRRQDLDKLQKPEKDPEKYGVFFFFLFFLFYG